MDKGSRLWMCLRREQPNSRRADVKGQRNKYRSRRSRTPKKLTIIMMIKGCVLRSSAHLRASQLRIVFYPPFVLDAPLATKPRRSFAHRCLPFFARPWLRLRTPSLFNSRIWKLGCFDCASRPSLEIRNSDSRNGSFAFIFRRRFMLRLCCPASPALPQLGLRSICPTRPSSFAESFVRCTRLHLSPGK
jgi:hypothetical protein